MKKIGIMSMQRIANYGSFLQAFALKQLLLQMGDEVEFVDYHVQKPVLTDSSENSGPLVRKIIKGMDALKIRSSFYQKIQFICFKQSFQKKYLPLLGVSKTMDYTPYLDCLIIGSDEVFNCIQKNSNVGYSLELFGENNNAKRLISYAASFGNTTVEKLQKYHKDEEISILLKNFDQISVRDKNSFNIVKKLTGKEPLCHLDPVLIYDYMNSCKLIPKIKVKERFLILYAYSGRITEKEARWISSYAQEKGLKIYAIGGIHQYCDRFINCSPFEVLAYFNNADEVITDTFHGTIFSVITHRKFATIIRKSLEEEYGNEEKLTDLLERLQLDCRIAHKIENIRGINSEDIDYVKVNEIIASERKRALQYLSNTV